MNEITTYSAESINTLKNVSLKKELRNMLSAVQSGRKSVWKYAQSIHSIITKETFKDDFESQTAFAKYIDVSKATITNYIKAVDFAHSDKCKRMLGDIVYNITVGKAYMLSTLSDEQLDDFNSFCQSENIDMMIMSDKALKDMLNELYGAKKAVEKKANAESETDANSELETDANAESETDANAESETDANAESETDANAESETDANAESETDMDAIAIATFTDDCEHITIRFEIAGVVKNRTLALDDEIIELLKIAREMK